MGDHEGWAQPGDLLPNGLLPNEGVCLTRELDSARWLIAEERTAELITLIQPNQPSEELRNAVADYVQRLIMRCFSCQVFTFGSVPLKTYLPDGDIDLTAFSNNQTLKDTWANEVRIMLENEEKSENAEFRVKEVQYIQAEVKLIKCLVENIVVDISFNQLGGLCTLCFLEEVDHLINQNHLFKRSIILIKAWCYYESRILGAHHGLISTYALETLVLYIFHVFNNSFSGPLEVLYRFLEFFSNFDWENFCVSLWGPVPIRSLPDMTAESPRKDNGELLLSKLFLDSCSTVYAVVQSGQENQGQPFVSKHFNVIDPLRTNNNLGRSVSKGNFFRIRSAFGFGAKRLARLLDCPKENIITEVNQFFMNTWERHGTGHRPDAPTASLLRLHRLNLDHLSMPEKLRNQLSSTMNNENPTSHESEADGYHTIQEIPNQHVSEGTSRTSYLPSASHKQGQKNYANRTSSRVSDQVAWSVNSSETVNNDKALEIPKPGYLKDAQERYQFVRTRSSPELLNNSIENSSRGRRHRAPDTGKTHIDSLRSDNSSRKKNMVSEVSCSHNIRSSVNDPSSFRHTPSHQSFDTSTDSNSASNYHHDGLNTLGEDLSSLTETMERHQEEQDLVNMMASSGFHGFNGQVQMPMNIAASRLPFPISPSVLASIAYAQRNMPGMIPGSIPLVDPHWGTNIQFPQGLVPSSLSHYFPSMGLTPNPGEMIDSHGINPGLPEVSQEQNDQDTWNEEETTSTRDFSDVNGNKRTMQFDDKQHSGSIGHNVVLSSRSSSGSSSNRKQHNSDKESKGLVREDRDDSLHQKNRGSEGHSTERIANLRSSTTSHISSSRSRASSESSWDESSVKVSKSTRDKRGRKPAPSPTPSTVFGEDKSGSQYERVTVDHGSLRANDDIRDWIPLSTMSTEMAGSTTMGASHTHSQQIPNYDSAQMSVSESMLPMAPMVLGSGSRQGTLDNSRVLPYTFFPTGPPVPFLTMLPVYNFANDTGNSDTPSSHFDKEEEEMNNSRLYRSEQNIDSAECLDPLETLSNNSRKNGALLEHLEEQKSDILHSDFSSHWQNLQFGRFCQNPRHHGPLFYHSPVMVPPMYLQGHFQWDGPGRPNSSNGNVISQVMGYGHRLVPIAPLQPSSNRPAGVYQRFGDEIPRYRGGTGTYLPNTKVTFRDRQSSGSRNHRGNYNYDHNDHASDRDGNWNNSKQRNSGRHYSRTQSEKGNSRLERSASNDNRTNRSWDPHRHESYTAHHSQNGPIGSSNPALNGPTNGVYSMQAANSNGVAPPGTGAPPVLMLYSYDPNVGFGSNAEQVAFGSVGRPHLSGMSEIPQHSEGNSGRGAHGQQRFRGNSALSSPDQPSSPHFQRLAGEKNYQLKDEDFPPLSFPNHGRNVESNNCSGKLPQYQTLWFTST